MSVDTYKNIKTVKDFVTWFCKDCKANTLKAVASISELKDKMQELEENVEKKIGEKVEEYMNEKMERKKRRENVVIFGLKEAPTEVTDANRRVEYDMNLVTSLHEGVSEELKIERDDIAQVVRLGRKSDGAAARAGLRPLHIRFKDVEKKHQIWV